MRKTLSFKEMDLFNAINKLQIELQDRSEEKDAQDLSKKIKEILKQVKGAKTQETAITLALDAINKYEPARKSLEKYISNIGDDFEFKVGGYEPLPGIKQPIKPGPLLRCPKRGCLYKQYLIYKGDIYVCPDHNCELIPATKYRKRK